jgi:hypothetical protein
MFGRGKGCWMRGIGVVASEAVRSCGNGHECDDLIDFGP